MTRGELLNKIEALTVWKNGDQRAPHKPLLILHALAAYQQSKQSKLPYSSVDPKLERLLYEFGRPVRNIRTHYPFWRLKNDSIWTIDNAKNIRTTSQGDPYKKDLKKHDVAAGFKPEVVDLFDREPDVIQKIASLLLDAHFPQSIHADIIQEVGLDMSLYGVRRKRDPAFREEVLTAYGYKCAVCDFNVYLGPRPVGIEAAHIKWHKAGGPDEVSNGMALCTMHHKMFDLGVFTIDEQHRFILSEKANGSDGFDEWLKRYHGSKLSRPINEDYVVGEPFIAWNHREVFKGRRRDA